MAKHELDDVVQWHHLDVNDVVERLETDQHCGLTLAESQRRLAREGPNCLPPPRKRPAWLRFLFQFHNVLIYMMLVATVIAMFLSHWIDAAVLLAAVIGFIQEGKAEIRASIHDDASP